MEDTVISPSSRNAPGSVEWLSRLEFGCEHIKQMMSHSACTSRKFRNAFISLQKDILKSPSAKLQTTTNYKDGRTTSVALSPTYLCIQCSFISTPGAREEHVKIKRHVFSLESRSGYLHCGICEDFVYDPKLESIRNQIHALANGKRHAKLMAFFAEKEEGTPFGIVPCLDRTPRGLYNLGQSCYLSVILQAMLHNPVMKAYFVQNRHDSIGCLMDHCIACVLARSISEISKADTISAYAPVDLLATSWHNSAIFAGFAQQDAHEYFQFILNQLHDATGQPGPREARSCACISHLAFSGRLLSTVTCLSCDTVTESSDPIIDLSLDIHAHTQNRGFTAAPPPPDSSYPDLTACLKQFTTPEHLPAGPADAGYMCRSALCGHTYQMVTKHLTIKKLPPTLCIQVKSYHYSCNTPAKTSTRMQFPLQLDMSPYTTRFYHHHHRRQEAQNANPTSSGSPAPRRQRPPTPRWYDLSSMVVHLGTMDGGHYVIYCKRENAWMRFDDHVVTPVAEATVLEEDPYMLFYVARGLESIVGDDGRV